MKKMCPCGNPQSFPIPHEHDRTDREKEIIDHYEREMREIEIIRKIVKKYGQIRIMIEGDRFNAQSGFCNSDGLTMLEALISLQEHPALKP